MGCSHRVAKAYRDDPADTAAAKAEERFDEAQAETEAELREQVPEELIRGDVFEAQEMAQIEAELEASRAFVPEFDDVQSFLAYFFRLERGKLEPAGEDGVFRCRPACNPK